MDLFISVFKKAFKKVFKKVFWLLVGIGMTIMFKAFIYETFIK